MPKYIGLVRGINVGGNNLLKMSDLKTICESAGFTNVQTYVNSGNVIFDARSPSNLAKKIEDGIRRSAGLDVRVVVRTPDELRAAIAANPFPVGPMRELKRMMITFLSDTPSAAGRATFFDACKAFPEEVHLEGRELYIYYSDGDGPARSKLANMPLEKKLGVTGTARNWNTVTKLLELATSRSRRSG